MWDLVELPHGKRAIRSKWVFKKRAALSETEQPTYKAQLVAKGFVQKQGVDYNEIFSHVMKHTSIRTILAMVAHENMDLEQLDVKTTFLHGELEEVIYMHQPKGFVVLGAETQVCRPRKSLYGLKQSPRQWIKKFDSYMLRIGYSRCKFDCCVYMRLWEDGSPIYLMLYVDDMLIASKNLHEIARLKALLSREFETKNLGVAKKILGMEIHRDRDHGCPWLTKRSYLEKIVELFGMGNAKVVSTPLANHFKLSNAQCPKSEEGIVEMKSIPYASVVGSLMYAMVYTRTDIAHAVELVSRFMSSPGKEHWCAVKWILRYLMGTTDVGLLSEKRSSLSVCGYVDADFASNIDN